MARRPRRLRLLIYFILGAGIGHLLVHPYAMMAYSVMEMYRAGRFQFQIDHVFSAARSIFDPFMLPMTVSFSLLCGLVALLIGVVREKKRKLHEAAIENERNRASIETLHRLMVTLSHYLLNSTAVIGGSVRHCRKHAEKDEIASSMKVIETEAMKIDAVMAALKKITDIKTADYTSEGHGLMLDIAKDIDELLKK